MNEENPVLTTSTDWNHVVIQNAGGTNWTTSSLFFFQRCCWMEHLSSNYHNTKHGFWSGREEILHCFTLPRSTPPEGVSVERWENKVEGTREFPFISVGLCLAGLGPWSGTGYCTQPGNLRQPKEPNVGTVRWVRSFPEKELHLIMFSPAQAHYLQ